MIPIYYSEFALRKTDVPVRILSQKRWMKNRCYHQRVQKKWIKKWGYVMEAAMYSVGHNAIFAHPSFKAKIESAIEEGTIIRGDAPIHGTFNLRPSLSNPFCEFKNPNLSFEKPNKSFMLSPWTYGINIAPSARIVNIATTCA